MVSEARVVLDARVAAGVGGTFAVDIFDAATALPEEECLRFALQYYARALFELIHTQRSVRMLPSWMAAIAGHGPEGDLFAAAGVDGKLVESIQRPLAEVTLEMCVTGVRGRVLRGDLSPFRGRTLPASVIAVCQATLPHLSPSMRGALPVALANMNASYQLAHRYADPASQHEVPETAYYAAAFG